MITKRSYCNIPGSSGFLSIETHSLLCLDQWVKTKHNGVAVIGRILAVLNSPESAALYEVELPLLQIHQGRMTHVVRFARELRAIGCNKLADIKGAR